MEENKIARIEQVCDLINQTVIPRNKKLNRKQQITFAYKYWTENPEDLTELYDYLAQNYTIQNEKLAHTIGEFLNNQQITTIKKFSNAFYNSSLNTILKATALIRENGNWLSKYSIEREYDSTSKHRFPIIYSYQTKSGERLTIDKTAADNILGMLIDSNIPTAKCIVLSSFPYYANDNMDTYIKSFQKIK